MILKSDTASTDSIHSPSAEREIHPSLDKASTKEPCYSVPSSRKERAPFSLLSHLMPILYETLLEGRSPDGREPGFEGRAVNEKNLFFFYGARIII